MKALILIALISLGCFPAAAQTDSTAAPKHLAMLQVSLAYPHGDFKESHFEDPYPAFAREGLLLTGSYRYSFSRRLSAGASVRYRHNKYDLDRLGNMNDGLLLRQDAKAWQSVFTMADGFYNFLLNEKAVCYLGASAGASFNRSASWELATKYGDIYMPADKATALALGWSVGFNYFLSPKVALNLDASALYTQPTFTVPDVKGEMFEHRQPMHSSSFNVGVAYAF